MKICLVTEYFYPYSSGGTEKYVYLLAQKLIESGNEVQIYTKSAIKDEDITYQGISIKANFNNQDSLTNLENYLRSEKFDLLHFHTLTPFFNSEHLSSIKDLVKQIHFTAHIPGITCIQGDLLRFGEIPCDGMVTINRCTTCYIHKAGYSKAISPLMAGLITNLKFPKSIANVSRNKLNELEHLKHYVNQIFIFTKWQKDVFRLNGFREEQLSIAQQMEIQDASCINKKVGSNKIKKIGFVGRMVKEKGLHILIEAFLDLNNSNNLELQIAGISVDSNDAYYNKILHLIENQANIKLHINIPPNQIHTFYQEIDVLCIPSIFFETGPFVLYEALSQGIPVYAMNRGDMPLWKERGYQLELFNSKEELVNLLKQLQN